MCEEKKDICYQKICLLDKFALTGIHVMLQKYK